MPASIQPPMIEVGPFLELVPFHRSLYIAELTLSEVVHLAPRTATGTPSGLRPILGARTFYRITGDGTSYVTFDPNFIKTRESQIFNRDLGVVNLIVFEFDGDDFRYTIIPEVLGVEFPRWVGNFGVEGDQLVLVGHTLGDGVIQDSHPPRCTRSAFNLIKSLHYTGETPLIYGVSKDGAIWVESEDPKNAFVSFSCAEVGAQSLFIRARAVGQPPTTMTPVVEVSITITDTEGYCV